MKRHFLDSEYSLPGAEFTQPPEQPETLQDKRKYPGALGVPPEPKAAVEDLGAAEPTLQAAETTRAASVEADSTQAAARKTKRKRSLLLQMAAIASSVVLVTNSFGLDFLGLDGLFNDSVIVGQIEESTEAPAETEEPTEPEPVFTAGFPVGGDKDLPRLEGPAPQDPLYKDAHNRFIAAVEFSEGSMGKSAVVTGFIWVDPDSNGRLTGPVVMSYNEPSGSMLDDPAIVYDSPSNSLLLREYSGQGLLIVGMGNDFTVDIEGQNKLSQSLIAGGGSVTLTGGGLLTVNQEKTEDYGIMLAGGFSETALMVGSGVSLEIGGKECAVTASSTCAEKMLWLVSEEELPNIRQITSVFEDQAPDEADPNHYYTWLLIRGNNQKMVTELALYGKSSQYTPPETEPVPTTEVPTEPETEPVPVIVGEPLGGDSSFPEDLYTAVPDSEAKARIALFDSTQARTYLNDDACGSFEYPGLAYNAETNVLTLTNYKGQGIQVEPYGGNFTVQLVGKNSLSLELAVVSGAGTGSGGSIRFAGDGYLALNTSGEAENGLRVDVSNLAAQACVKIENSVTMDLYGNRGAIRVTGQPDDTVKGIYYLGEEIANVRQVSQYSNPSSDYPNGYYNWYLTDDTGFLPAAQLHIGGEVPTDPETVGLPIGGDTGFPILPNPQPAGGNYPGMIWVIEDRFSGEEFSLSSDGSTGPEGRNDISYDAATNTLTLNNFSADILKLDAMGSSLKIRLVGKNEIVCSLSVMASEQAGGCVTFTGDGYLSINDSREDEWGLHVFGSNTQACVMIEDGVTMDIYGSEAAVTVRETSAAKAIYYLSGSELAGVRQFAAAEDASSGGLFLSWETVDDAGLPVTHIHLGGEVPPDPELPGLPVGGDSEFPELPNPEPNTPVPGYGLLNEDYVQLFDRETNAWPFLYLNPAWTDERVAQEGISYNRETNTLTLNNYHGKGISVNLLGNGFTVELIGENELEQDFMVWGFYTGGSIRFTGTGSLTINSSQTQDTGLQLICEYSTSCLMIDPGVTLDIYGNGFAVEVIYTNAEKGFWLLSERPLRNVRQVIAGEDTSELDGERYQAWVLTDNAMVPITHWHISGQTLENP